MATNDTSPGIPKKVTVPNVKTLIGITTFKEFIQRLSPYNNTNANINFLTKENTFFSMFITFI